MQLTLKNQKLSQWWENDCIKIRSAYLHDGILEAHTEYSIRLTKTDGLYHYSEKGVQLRIYHRKNHPQNYQWIIMLLKEKMPIGFYDIEISD
jgi:hypothetical protein